MRYLSLFSGIEAATVAWKPLGWECVAVAETEKFPCAVLKHHYPDVPNLGDVTKITSEQIRALGRIDLVVGGFPCFPKGTFVLTARGLIDISDVTEGDLVWTHRNRWRKVTKHHGSRMAQTVRMKGHGCGRLITTANHRFYAASRRGEPDWVDAVDMEGMFWCSPTHVDEQTRDVPGWVHDREAFFWVLGHWLANGWVVEHRRTSRTPVGQRGSRVASMARRVHWCAHHDKADGLRAKLEAAGISTTKCVDRTATKFVKQSAELADLLADFGKYAHGKTVPLWVMSSQERDRRAFLDGYLAGDGSAYGDGWRATTVSKRVAIGIRLIAVGLGWSVACHFTERPMQTEIEGRAVNQLDTWQLVGVPSDKRTSSWVSDGLVFGLVRDVRETGVVEEVFDIEVDEDHSFVADGMVVHNCQDISVAGKRKGLRNADGSPTRSGLFFDAMRLVRAADPRWLVIENVPGLFSSNRGRDFAAVVGEILGITIDVPRNGWRNAGVAASKRGLAEWSVLDAAMFGLAQRRQRVFIVADFGDWTSRPPVLLERESLLGDSAPRPQARQDVTGTLGARTTAGGGLGTDFDLGGGSSQPDGVAAANPLEGGVSHALTAHPGGRYDFETENFVAHTLTGGGFDASEDGTGRGTLLVADGRGYGDYRDVRMVPTRKGDQVRPETSQEYWQRMNETEGLIPDVAGTLPSGGRTAGSATNQDAMAGLLLPIPFDETQITNAQNRSQPRAGDPSHPLAAGARPPTIAFNARQDPYPSGDKQHVMSSMTVRRITPKEACRLQGFSDEYLDIVYRKKPAADGPKYRALGNSKAIPVVRWIGERIAAVMTSRSD